MAQPKRAYKRTTFFINPRFQGWFIAGIIFFNFFICSVFYGAQRYVFRVIRSYGSVQANGAESGFLDKYVELQQNAMNYLFIATMLIMTCISIIIGLYFSHKIAGPLYHLNKFLKEKAAGTSQEKILRFRKGDYFGELADTTNNYIDSKK